MLSKRHLQEGGDNMKYEYNGHLLEEERVNLVAQEITNKYPEISYGKAKDIARLEDSISTNPNLKIEFNRLYNIIVVMQDDLSMVKKVFVDLIEVINKYKRDKELEYYYDIAKELMGFIKKERPFPYLEEFKKS